MSFMAISTLNHLSLTNYTQLPTIYDNNDDDMSTITTSQQVSQMTPPTINNNTQESSNTISSNPLQSNILYLLHSGIKTDVSFDVNGTIIRAHKFIIEACAPTLFHICNNGPVTFSNDVSVENIVDTFRYMLEYIYGGDLSESNADVLRLGKDIIAIAYQFGVHTLKDQVEQALIKSDVVDQDNSIEYITFAMEHECLSLTRHAISFFVDQPHNFDIDPNTYDRLKQYPGLMHKIIEVADEQRTIKRSNKLKTKQIMITTGQWKKSLYDLKTKSKTIKQSVGQRKKRKKLGRNQDSPLSGVLQLKKTKPEPINEDLNVDEIREEARRILKAVSKRQRSTSRRRRVSVKQVVVSISLQQKSRKRSMPFD